MSGQARAIVVLAALVGTGLLWCGSAAAAKKKRQPTALRPWIQQAAERATAHSDADLAWLHEEYEVSPLAGGVQFRRRIAARVLRPAGIAVVSSWPVYYVDGDRVQSIDAWTLAPGRPPRRADRDDDVTDRPLLGDGTISDSRVKIVQAQGVSVGSVVAFESVVVRAFDSGAASLIFGSPDRVSAWTRFAVRVPPGWTVDRVERRADELTCEALDDGFECTAGELPPLPRGERRPPAGELLPVVWARWHGPDGARGFRTWDDVGRWFTALAAPTLNELGDATALAERMKPTDPSMLLGALADAFEFAARSVRYVAIDYGLGLGAGYTPDTPATVCRNRYGDCKDKAFLLRAIAEQWGVATYPVLVATRGSGAVDPDVPTPQQFNHCIAAVRLPDGVEPPPGSWIDVDEVGRLVLLDATVRNGSPWALRSDIQGTSALLVLADGARLIRLPEQRPEHGAVERRLSAELADDGRVLRGTLVERWTGTRATRVRDVYADRSDAERRAQVLEDLQGRFPEARISAYAIEGLESTREPVVETTTFEAGRIGKRVGDLLIVEPGRVGYGVVRGSLPRPPRAWRFRAGLPKLEIVDVELQLPAGWVPESLGTADSLDHEMLGFEASWAFGDDAVLRFTRHAELRRAEIESGSYETFRDHVKRLRGVDRQAVVFVRE